jgi:hypothetical protein
VIDSDVEAFIVDSPAGVVKVISETGPIRIRGEFADAPGRVQTRSFAGKFLYLVEPAKTAACELIVVPKGVTKQTDILRRSLDVDAGEGPRPPPVPPVPPGPTPPVPPVPPNPAPIPVAGFRVLMIEESADRAKIPPAQLAAMFDARTRTYLNSKCVTGPDGRTREWRLWDQNSDASNESKLWRDAFARPRQSLPWIIISDGMRGFEGPLPVNTDELLKLLKQYGGE